MKRNGFFVQSVLKSFIAALMTEMLFRAFSFETMFDLSLIRITLFSIAYSLILSGICSFLPVAVGNAAVILVNLFLPVYAVFELGYNGLMGHYVSLKSAGQGAKVGDYVEPFLKCLKPQYLLFLVPVLLVIIWSVRVKTEKEDSKTGIILFLIMALAVNLGGVATVYAAGLSDLYNDPAYISKGFLEFGLARFLIRDMTTGLRSTGGVVADDTDEEEEEKDDPEIRLIDDTEWLEMMEAETDETMQTIDSFLYNRSSSNFNDMTGYFEGKNFVYILVESLDYMAVDEKLTPTLYKMMHEGWNFSNHYTPRYNCTTGDTGFITEVSLIPDNSICTENEYAKNAWPNGIFQQFANSGYKTFAFHNWWDEYYERRTYYKNEGCQVYKNYDDLDIHTITGWQSDLELMQLSVPEFINEDHFMAAIITSAMHYPYTKYSVLGTRYLDEVNKVHPDYPDMVKNYLSKCIDFDKSLEYLLKQLEKAGKLEDTVIMVFNDHHPFEMEDQMIADYSNTDYDRMEALNIDRGPLIIYNAGEQAREFTGVNSTFDMLPTILNLFNISYDPRLYFGTDYFSDNEKVVYMPEGDWITDKGIYYMETGKFVGEVADQKYVTSITRNMQNMINVSKMIYQSNYFKYRQSITNPVYLNTAPAVLQRQLAQQASAMDIPEGME